MELKDIAALAKSLAPSIRDYVAECFDKFRKELDIDARLESVRVEVRSELKALSESTLTKEELLAGAREIIDSHSVDMKSYIVELISDIPLPDDPLTIEEITKHIAIPHDEIAELRGQIDEVKSAALTMHAVESNARQLIDSAGTDIKLYIAEQIAALPPAPEIPEIEPLDYEEIAKNLAIPEDELAEIVDDRVRIAVSQMPTPKDGESVPLEQVQAMVDAAVAKAMESVSPPEDGKDADPEEMQRMVDASVTKSVSEIELPPVDLPDFEKLVDDSVAKAMSGIPMPEDGKDIDPAEVQKMVDIAVSAIEIKSPADGNPGRDGLDIDILPEIETEKSYPRGTYAQHQGGLWRSHCKTHGVRGWECVVDGIAEIDVDFGDDPRHVTIRTMKSSGVVVEKQIYMPVVVDKGVFRKESQYEKGDGVTYGGCFWISQKDAPEGVPGTAPDWRLAVKKGRDANRGDK